MIGNAGEVERALEAQGSQRLAIFGEGLDAKRLAHREAIRVLRGRNRSLTRRIVRVPGVDVKVAEEGLAR